MAARVKLDNYAVADAPRLGPSGWARWMWRQVTSMRVALILLLMLGVASIPGSILPQWQQTPADVRGFLAANGAWGELLDRLGMFDVFNSAWFTAIYVLLFASLVGCIVPRTFHYARAFREPPAAAPSSLARYEAKAKATATVSDPRQALERAASALRAHGLGYRVRIDERAAKPVRAARGDGSAKSASAGTELALAAEKGHVRELGNLAFHLAIVGVIITAALGSFLSYRGQAIVIEGRSFTNAVVAYDSFEPGRAFNPERLEPFTVTLDAFHSEFSLGARPLDFRADVTVTAPGEQPRTESVWVNRPLHAGGAKVYLQGNGYAPAFTIRDAAGNIAFSGAVPFIPQDDVYTSTGVVKVPDVTSGIQFGLRATLLPSAAISGESAFSLHPAPANPVIVFEVFVGNLGLDDGVAQNVYVLDELRLSPVRNDDGDVATFIIAPGETVELPGGLATVTWDSLPRFVAFDLRADPTLPWLLASALLALAGVGLSLFGSRRRIWLISPATGPAKVEGAAYAPFHDEGLQAALDRAIAAVTIPEE